MSYDGDTASDDKTKGRHSTIVRAHPHSAGAKKSWSRLSDRRPGGGLSTKIHATVDALSNPTGFFLTGGEAHDLVGADHLLPQLEAQALIADKAFDAEQRVIQPSRRPALPQ